MFTIKKVFDCQNMPDGVKREFFDNNDSGNDCYVSHNVDSSDKVGKWLIENGAENGEDVIISHWW